MAASRATIEHFNNDGLFKEKYNVAISCRRCNSSKGTMSLSAWFKTPYCREKKINEEPFRHQLRSSCDRKNPERGESGVAEPHAFPANSPACVS